MERLTYRPANPYISKTSGELVKAYSDYSTREIINRLADYEDMEENGRIVILPCKVGDTVYVIHRRFNGSDCIREMEFWWTDIPQLGKTVFLHREEAEKVLEAKRDG